MKITIKLHRDVIVEEKYLPVYRLLMENGRRWQSFGAGISLGGGLLSPTAGGFLNLLYSFTRLGFQFPVLHKLSMILYALTMPLLMLGAHFLDLLEKKNVEARREETANPKTGTFAVLAKTEDRG